MAADTGLPVPRVQVTLRSNSNAGISFAAFTDPSGLYEIRNIDPGVYFALANKSGFLPTGPAKGVLTLTGDQDAKDVDFQLTRAGVISGIVLDDHDEPVPDIVVAAVLKVYPQGALQLQSRGAAQTDDRGRYRIHDLPPGRYYVQAMVGNSGRPGPHYVASLYPGVQRVEDAQSLRLSRGEEIGGIKLHLRETEVYSVTGRVVDAATGAPAAGININVEPADYNGFFRGSATTRADGTFRLTELAPGQYRAFLTQPSPAPGQPQTTAARLFYVGDHNVEELTLRAGGAYPTVKGRITALGGDLTKLSVTLSPRQSKGRGGGALMYITTEADGSFLMTNVPPGMYELSIRRGAKMNDGNPNAFSVFFVSSVVVNNRELNDADPVFTVPDEGSAVEVNATIDYRGGTATGTISDADGKPEPGMMAILMASDPAKRNMQHFFYHATDHSGAFSIPGVAPGDYLLVPWPGPDPMSLLDPDIAALVEKYATGVSISLSGTSSRDLRMSSEITSIARTYLPN